MNTHLKKDIFIFCTLGLLVSLPALSMDIYIPLLPKLILSFNEQSTFGQLTVTFFLAGLSITFVPLGYFSDKIGRRKIIFTGLTIFIISTLLCLISDSTHLFLVSRLFQGVGASCGTISSFSIARDLYDGENLVRAVGVISTFLGTTPIIAPLIGTVLGIYFAWKSTYVFLLLFSILALTFVSFLEETNKNKNAQMSCKSIFFTIINLFSTRKTCSYAILITVAFSSVLAYLIIIPFVYEKVYLLDSKMTGILISMNASAFVLGGILVSRFLFKRPIIIIILNCYIFLGTNLIAVILLWTGFFRLPMLVLCLFISTLCISILISLATSAILQEHKNSSGIITSIISSIRFGSSALLCFVVARLALQSTTSLLLIFITAGTVSVLLLIVGGHHSRIHEKLLSLKNNIYSIKKEVQDV